MSAKAAAVLGLALTAVVASAGSIIGDMGLMAKADAHAWDNSATTLLCLFLAVAMIASWGER